MAAHDTLFPFFGTVSINTDMVEAVIFKVKEFFIENSRLSVFFDILLDLLFQ